MMASFYYQDQNAVTGLYCQATFPIDHFTVVRLVAGPLNEGEA